MCKKNEVKLLEGLTGKGVTLNTRSLARYTADNGVLVSCLLYTSDAADE